MSQNSLQSSQVNSREKQRERERNQRLNHTSAPFLSNANSNSLFSEPIKQQHDDETSKRIKSTLGDFDQVQLYLIKDPKPLIGISTREITRIKGHKAKIEQILSEMKQTLEPITAIDEDINHNSNNINPNLSNNTNNTLFENSINISENRQTGRNKREDALEDIVSDEDLVSMKPRAIKRRRSLKIEDRERAPTSSSSNSSASSSTSSSSSSSSSDEEPESVNVKTEPFPVQDTPNMTHALQPEIPAEIASWDLEEFMPKEKASSETANVLAPSSHDSMTDIIEKVAIGELGDSPGSNSSLDLSPKKKRKSAQERKNDDRVRENPCPSSRTSQGQANKTQHRQEASNELNQRLDKTESTSKTSFSPLRSSPSPLSAPPDPVLVSINLKLLKRIPGQQKPIATKKGEDHESDNSNSSEEESYKPVQKLNAKSRVSNHKVTKAELKSTDSKAKDLNKNGTSKAKPKSPAVKREKTPKPEATIKQEPTTPPIKSEPLETPPQSISSISLPPPPTVTVPLRTPPEIPSSAQPDDYLNQAKKLKHAADRETDRTAQACRYLEAVLYFILTGNAMEQKNASNDVEKVCQMYKDTLNLARHVSAKCAKSRTTHQSDISSTDHKLTTLSIRCQSLLYLRLCRLKNKEIRDTAKYIQQQFQELSISPNISNSSTSVPGPLLSAMHRQLTLLQQLNTAHDLWQQADHLIEKQPSCKAFFTALDGECGCLTLNSTFDHLVHYVRTGLKILK